MLSTPEASASSTPYWMIGLSTSGSISFGCALVAGRNRVPRPAAGKTAFRMHSSSTPRHPPVAPSAAAGISQLSIGSPRSCSIPRSSCATTRPRPCGAAATAALDADALLAGWAPLDERRRALIVEVEDLKRDQNAAAEEVAKRKKTGEDAAALVDANRARGQQVKERDAALQALEEQRRACCSRFPTCRMRRCRSAGAPTTTAKCVASAIPRAFDFEPKAHWDLGPALGILDFERGTKIARRALHRADRRRARGWRARSSTSCSTSTRASTATPRSSRRSW